MGKQWSAEIDITPELVYDLLIQQFPELRPIDVKRFDTGWDNENFLVNDTYVFRFPRRKIAVPFIEMENSLLPWLAPQLPKPIPNPIFMGVPHRTFPFAFSGYKKLAGLPPHCRTLNVDHRACCARDVALFLRALHRVPVSLAIQHGTAQSDVIGRMDLNKRLPMFMTKVEEAYEQGLIERPERLLHVADDVAGIGRGTREERALVHGDLNFRNFLVAEDGALTGVIDWGDAHIGDKAIDLSLVYSYLPVHTHAEFFRCYGEVSLETLKLARFRALYTNLVILLYAHDIADAAQVTEAKRSIHNALIEGGEE